MGKGNNQNRKSIRLKDYDYSSGGNYFVTIVSYQRKDSFGKIVDAEMNLNQIGLIVEEVGNAIPSHYSYVSIDTYIIMPSHLHGILIINDTNVRARHASPLRDIDSTQHKRQPLGIIIGSFKFAVTKRIHNLDLLSQEKIWQRGYYEHIIRDERDYEKIYEYIEANPINWSLDEENMTSERFLRPFAQLDRKD